MALDMPVNAAEIGFPIPGMNLAALAATDCAVETTSRPNFATLAPTSFAKCPTFFAAKEQLREYLVRSGLLIGLPVLTPSATFFAARQVYEYPFVLANYRLTSLETFLNVVAKFL